MNSKPSNDSREPLQDNTSVEAVQPESTQMGDLEEVATSNNLDNMTEIPRPLSTPRMKVQS